MGETEPEQVGGVGEVHLHETRKGLLRAGPAAGSSLLMGFDSVGRGLGVQRCGDRTTSLCLELYGTSSHTSHESWYEDLTLETLFLHL